MKIRSFVLLSLLFSFCTSKNTAQELTNEEALADLNQLKTNFESYHSGYTRYTSRDSLNYYFGEVEKRLSDCSTIDLYKEVTWILNKIRCGHTRASLPDPVQSAFIAANTFLPLSISILNNRMFVDGSLTESISAGAEILSINDIPTNKILREIYSHHSSDGYINSNKHRLTSRYFPYYFQLYLADGASSYELQLSDGEMVRIDGVNRDQLERIRKPSPSAAELILSHEADYSYLRIGSFGSYALDNNGYNYTRFLKKSFKELKDRNAENLILDLRGNGGGSDNYGALLVSYLLDQPFGYFERIEVTDAYTGRGEVERVDNRRLMRSHSGLDIQQVQDDNFQGTLYLLTDGWTFSTAADVVSVLDNANRSVIIGEETGGGRFGNTSGASTTLHLSNSKISINLPMWKYTTALDEKKDNGRGVIPDIQLTPTIEQILTKEDVQLNYCLREIRKGR
ncbi:MAG: S41 family peptidase [Cyclobacteriaceae bacterium]